MTRTARKAPWLLARSAQVAIAATAVADAFRASALRDDYLEHTDASLSKSGFISMAFVYLMTLAVVLFLVWLARCRHNAQELSPQASLPSRGWTIGAWFVPVANLFIPRRFALDIGRASSVSWEEKRDTRRVNLWWGAWIGHTLVMVVAELVSPVAPAAASMALLVVAEALMIAAAVLVGLVIERITTLQNSALGAVVPAAPLAPS